MKKNYTAVLAAIIVISILSACQATPEEPVVIQKDMEQMIEKAQAIDTAQETPGVTLREQTRAPQTLVMEEKQGNMTLSVNAVVSVPDADSMPILNVRSAVFSQETVDKYWNALVGDRPMWEWFDQPTKEQIEQMIVNQRQIQDKAEQEGQDTGNCEEFIAELGKMYQTAPVTTEVMPATSQLKEKINWDPVLGTIDTRYMGTSGHSTKNEAEVMDAGDRIYFSASNPWTGEEGSIKSDTSPATIRFESFAINNNYFNSVAIDENTVLDASTAALLKMTPREAKRKVEDFLTHTGTPMMVYSMRLMNDADQETGKQAKNYAYGFTCVRILDNGLTVCATPKGSASNIMPPGYLPNPSAPSFSLFWTYEFLEIEMDDNGFFQICWQSPIEVLDTEVDSCNLLPFEDIKGVFEKMLYASYEPNIQNGYTMACNISQVRLEMMRIRKQNSNPNDLEGLLIPVWNFYGMLTLYDNTGKPVSGSMENATILSINAIDGSVIDPQQGY